MNSLGGELLVPQYESFLLLNKDLEFILSIWNLILTVLIGDQLIIDVIDFKLDLLHPKHTLDTWLSVETQANIDALHIIQGVFFGNWLQDLFEVLPYFYLYHSGVVCELVKPHVFDHHPKVLHLDLEVVHLIEEIVVDGVDLCKKVDHYQNTGNVKANNDDATDLLVEFFIHKRKHHEVTLAAEHSKVNFRGDVQVELIAHPQLAFIRNQAKEAGILNGDLFAIHEFPNLVSDLFRV